MTLETNPIFPAKAQMLVWTGKGCAPCAAMKKKNTWEEIAKHYVLPVKYFDSDKDNDEFERHEISALPTCQVVIEDDGERLVLAEFEGAGPLQACIDVLLEGYSDWKAESEYAGEG